MIAYGRLRMLIPYIALAEVIFFRVTCLWKYCEILCSFKCCLIVHCVIEQFLFFLDNNIYQNKRLWSVYQMKKSGKMSSLAVVPQFSAT